MFPLTQFLQYTGDLKRGPIQKFIRTLRHPSLIDCMGMRAQECANRICVRAVSLRAK